MSSSFEVHLIGIVFFNFKDNFRNAIFDFTGLYSLGTNIVWPLQNNI